MCEDRREFTVWLSQSAFSWETLYVKKFVLDCNEKLHRVPSRNSASNCSPKIGSVLDIESEHSVF